jgi:hypothetical protein
VDAVENPPAVVLPKKKGSCFRTVVMLVLAGLGCLALLVFVTMPRPPKESAVILNFYKNRSAFEQLRDMLMEDSRLKRVADWGVETRNPLYLGEASASSFPMERYRRYLALLKQVGGQLATRDEGADSDPTIIVWAWGWAGDTRHMGVCWNPINEQSQFPKQQIAFKHIDEKWYIWTDF